MRLTLVLLALLGVGIKSVSGTACVAADLVKALADPAIEKCPAGSMNDPAKVPPEPNNCYKKECACANEPVNAAKGCDKPTFVAGAADCYEKACFCALEDKENNACRAGTTEDAADKTKCVPDICNAAPPKPDCKDVRPSDATKTPPTCADADYVLNPKNDKECIHKTCVPADACKSEPAANGKCVTAGFILDGPECFEKTCHCATKDADVTKTPPTCDTGYVLNTDKKTCIHQVCLDKDSGTTTTVATCTDTKTQCESWQKNGFCESQYYDFATKKDMCAKTCNLCDATVTCTDNHKSCASWMRNGFCKNTAYTNEQKKDLCPRSCGMCGTTTSTCRDASSSCGSWNRNGFCSSTHYTSAQKKEKCAKTCKLC